MLNHVLKRKLPKRIAIAPDAYKGCLSADAVACAMQEGVLRELPGAELRSMPMADGGEGSLDILLTALGGERHSIELPGAGGSRLRADWGLTPGQNGEAQAVIEVAQVVGSASAGDTEVERRSSEGVGMLLRHGLDQGIRHFLICLGGSCANDGGAGLLSALGLRMLNVAGLEISPDLDGLGGLAGVEADSLDHRLASCRIDLLSDVSNPLCGSQGATVMYGPQKGVPIDRVPEYDARLRHFASLCEECLGIAAADRPGAGAAGGLGFALQLLGGSFHAGASMIADLLGLDAALKKADLVLTGEGRSDAQTFFGKVAYEVALRASRFGVPVALISGCIAMDEDDRWRIFNQALAATPKSMPLEEALSQAPALIADTADRAAKIWIGGE